MQTALAKFRRTIDLLMRADRALLLAARGGKHRLEPLMVRLGNAGEDGALWLAIGSGAAALDPARRRQWLVAAMAGPGAIVVNYPFKRLIRRARPQLELPRLGMAVNEHSFPSAHAASSFTAASAIRTVAPSAGAPAFALAGLVAMGRPYLGMHYPSDVLGGALVGLLLGRVAAPVLRSSLLETGPR